MLLPVNPKGKVQPICSRLIVPTQRAVSVVVGGKMAAAVAGAALLGKGLDISLAALQRHDPYISSIVDVASQVALYTFGHRANEWEKTDVEGTLFVYTRSASPRHGFTIMNRLSMENRTEPITKDLDFQLQDPFLLYRNARLSIYGIWFYDKEECQRIAELMKNLTQQEQFKARQGAGAGASPMIQSSGDSKEVDILRMLTKAKDEYTKCKTCSEPKQMTSSSAIYDNPNLIKPIPVKPIETQHQQIPQQGKNMDSEPQHLSLTALFGKQENPTIYQDVPEQSQKKHQLNLSVRQSVVRSLSYEEPGRHSPSAEKQLCPAIQKLMVRGTDLHPLSELPENRLCENGNVHSVGEVFTGLFQPVTSHGIVTSHPAQDTTGTQSLLQKLQGQSGSVTKMDPSATGTVSSTASIFSRTSAATASAASINNMTQPHLVYFNGSLPTQTVGPQAAGKEQSKLPRQPLSLSGNQSTSSGVISPQELLKKLQIVQQEQQLHVSSRPTLAAKFPVVTQNTNTLKPLDAWIDKTSGAQKQSPLFQVISPQRIPATVTPALLMSPMLFTQSTPAPPKASESGCLPPANQESASSSASLLLPMQNPEPSVVNSNSLTKMQLQETLLHLIQNDDNFLNIIYEAYLFSVRKAAIKKSM
ncbi:mRNA-decapping enzyme 1B isoform X1 [Mauremys reevesii]|uniref:mRNA-decapping enzyme 1B isoform X1 n=2 Tax=Mauremys reevesii TaxID=260615 RepID=UPI00193F830E|nr:mRNA-decapping enzyme 1B isoform X1 [Mauremys reevesii]XP_039402120.1 mRNA-decapping enzyme 1B isoform X1 [Mauremys reevesii]